MSTGQYTRLRICSDRAAHTELGEDQGSKEASKEAETTGVFSGQDGKIVKVYTIHGIGC